MVCNKMRNKRLEMKIESLCYGLDKWMVKKSECKYLAKYNTVECEYMQGTRCYNIETNNSKIDLYGLIKKR